jgi:hypothetical protein
MVLSMLALVAAIAVTPCLGSNLVTAVAVQGKYAYVGIHQSLVVVDISEPRRPRPLGQASFWPDKPPLEARGINSIAVSGNHAYVVYDLLGRGANVGAKNHDMVVFDVSNPSAPAVVASYSLAFVAWPFTVTVVGGCAYLHHSDGMELVDVSRPSDPRTVGSWASHADGSLGARYPVWAPLPGLPEMANENLGTVWAGSAHVAVAGSYAYVADRGGGLRVVDVSEPSRPKEVGSWEPKWTVYSVAVAEKRAFVIDGRYLHIIDLGDPKHPQMVGSFETHFHRASAQGVAVAGNVAYVFGIPASDAEHPKHVGGLQIVDVSHPGAPKEVHPGPDGVPAVYDPVLALALQGQYAYLGVRERLVVADISDPKRPLVVGSAEVVPGSLTDVAEIGDHAVVAGGRGGLRVLDVSQAKVPREVGCFHSRGAITTVAAAGDYVLAGGEGGLHLLDVADPTAVHEVAAYPTEWTPRKIAMVGKTAGVAADRAVVAAEKESTERTSLVKLLDLSEPAAPREVGSYEPRSEMSGAVAQIAACGDRLLVLGRPGTALRVVALSYLAWRRWVPCLTTLAALASLGLALLVFRLRRSLNRYLLLPACILVLLPPALLVLLPRAPREVGRYDAGGPVGGLAVAGRYAYLVGGSADERGVCRSWLWVVDLSDAGSPREIGSCKVSDRGFASAVAVAGEYAYVAEQGLRVVDISDPAAPRVTGSGDTPSAAPDTANSIAVAGQYAFVTFGQRGMWVFDISNPAAPKSVGHYESPLPP